MSNLLYLKKKYKRLSEEFEDSGFSKYQFEDSGKIRIPYKSIALAIILFISGLAIFIISLVNLLVRGLDSFNETMFILGSLMIIPGAYHVRIAYYAYRKVPGFEYDEIPDFE